MRTIVVHDKMQHGYRYTQSAPVGRSFDPRFKPQLTPQEMLALGVFGGVYMRDCTKEFPKRHAKIIQSIFRLKSRRMWLWTWRPCPSGMRP